MDEAKKLFTTLIGKWEGLSSLWFEPDMLADSAPIHGTFKPILNGDFLRHEYAGRVGGEERSGEETLIFNSITNRFEVAWIDTYHMSSAIMFSIGGASAGGFTVIGSYDVGADAEPWRWKTVYELIDNNHLKITAFNITPDGQEAKATEIDYMRQSEF